VDTRPSGHGWQVWVSPLRKVPAGHGAAADVSDVTVGAATVMLDAETVCKTGSLDWDSCVPTLDVNPLGEFKAAVTAVAKLLTLVRTEKTAVKPEATRRRPAAAGVEVLDSPVDVMTTVPVLDVRFSDAAMIRVSVAFCVCPKLDGDKPAKVRLLLMVNAVTDAKPGAAEIHATAPAEGEYDPGGQLAQEPLVAFRKLPAWQMHTPEAALNTSSWRQGATLTLVAPVRALKYEGTVAATDAVKLYTVPGASVITTLVKFAPPIRYGTVVVPLNPLSGAVTVMYVAGHDGMAWPA
jgi:hypothetical protein